jgi:predicted nucleic-acid-binding protein
MQAAEIIEGGEQCFVANIVFCELVWVLRSHSVSEGQVNLINLVGKKLVTL